MRRNSRTSTSPTGRCRPLVERLEARLALSSSTVSDPFDPTFGAASTFGGIASNALGPDLAPVETDPAPGAILTRAPGSVSVTFDRPLDPVSLLVDDILIQKRADDGSWSLAHDEFSAPTEELDATGTRLVLTPASPLAAGRYRLVLPRFSTLMGADGSVVADLGDDRVLAEFEINRPGVTLADAAGLGTIGPEPISLTGALDLAGDPGAVRLYRFDLPAGHHWRFGAEVSAQRQGSGLLSTLALFDDQGRLIERSSKGRPDAPADPYLYAGLAPGTYYLGLSGAGNVPGLQGYDPATGARGSIVFHQDSGPYRLTLLADPADSPTRVLGFGLNRADPLRNAPTGFSLTFSGLLDNDTLRGDPSPGIAVVNSQGQRVPVTAVGYHESGAQYFFLFDRAVAPGRYRVVVPERGGVADLAGLTPVAPGAPAGVLAEFTVSEDRSGPRDPRDLGPLYLDVQAGKSFHESIRPGAAVTSRFVVTAEGLYTIGTTPDAHPAFPLDRLTVQLLGPGRFETHDATPPGPPEVYLKPGVYYLQFVNQSATPARFTWTLTDKTLPDSLLDNGVGQGPALSLRLIQPTTAGATPAPDPTGTGPSAAYGPWAGSGSGSGSGPNTPAAPGGAPNAASSARGSSTLAPGGLVLTLGNTLVGRPSPTAEHVAVVGPTSSSGETALAYGQDGLPPGVSLGLAVGRGRSGRATGRSRREPLSPPREEAPESVPEPIDGSMVFAPKAPLADEMVIAAADWLTRLGDAAARMLERPDATPVGPDAETIAAEAMAQVDPDATPLQEGSVREAHFETPIVVGMATLMAMRYHPPFRRWIERRRGSRASAARPRFGNAPHRRS